MKATRDRQFRALAAATTPAVAAYLQRRMYPLNQADLDDLVEETLIIAWRRLEDIPEGAEIPWMIGVARNVRRNAVRKRERAELAQANLRPTGHSASAEDVVIADDDVRRALAALSEDDRDLLLLHAWDGLGAHEIAMILGITDNAAAVRLSRANDRFRSHFVNVEV